MQNTVDVCKVHSMLSIFNMNLSNHQLEPEVMVLSLIKYNQNAILGLLKTLENSQRTFWRDQVLLQKLRFFFFFFPQRTEQSHQWNPKVLHIKFRKQKFFPYLPRWKDCSKEDGLCSHRCEQDCFVAFHSTFLTDRKKNRATMFITKFTITELSYLLKKSLSFHWYSGFES